jgi:hypothetical protein
VRQPASQQGVGLVTGAAGSSRAASHPAPGLPGTHQRGCGSVGSSVRLASTRFSSGNSSNSSGVRTWHEVQQQAGRLLSAGATACKRALHNHCHTAAVAGCKQ